MLSINFWNILWTVVNLLVLYVVFRKFLYQRVMNVIEAREEMVKKQFDDVKKSEEDARKLKADYEERLSDARTEADQIIIDARARAEEEHARSVEKTREETEHMLEKAKEDIANEQEKAQQAAQAEIARLKVFEENAQHYQELKDKFDTDVVYTDNAPDISEYKSWYESIDSENAAKLYEQVVKDLQYSQQVKDWAETYSKMDAKNAAAILEEMTGDTDLVSDILLCMTSKQRAAILAEMDPVYAAKLTVIMYPAKG